MTLLVGLGIGVLAGVGGGVVVGTLSILFCKECRSRRRRQRDRRRQWTCTHTVPE